MTILRILGDAGHAREVEALATSVGTGWTEIRILGVDDEAAALEDPGDVALGMGNPETRLAVADRWGQTPGLSWPTLVHPCAQIGPRALLGSGVGIQTNVVVTTDVRVGDFTYLNFSATVGHDVRIGRCCLLNPGSNVSGGVSVGDGVLVGAGAVILENLTVGDGAIIGAGGVVTRDVPAGVTVAGVPAKPIGGRT